MTTHNPRQLIVLCDGTNNTLTGHTHDTNVVKLLEHLRAHEDEAQTIFYDPGVGSTGSLPAVTVWDEIKQWNQQAMGLAFGGGIFENIAEAYQFLMRNYNEGDQIFMFGFSRGAFTARCVAGLVNQFGLLQPQMEHMVPTLVQLYFKRRDTSDDAKSVMVISKQIKATFVSANQRVVDIQFVGVWDTVASVGFGPLKTKMTTTPTIQGKCFLNVRHAMSLDEQRAQFAVRLYCDDNDTSGKYTTASGKPASLIQQWFPGCHCDVGGGNPAKQSTLSNIALDWLVDEAISCGLRVAPSKAAATTVPESHPIQSQTNVTPLWALTGLHVRETRQVELDDGEVFHVAPVAHQNAFYETLAFPKSTLWAKHSSFKSLRPTLIALVIALVAYALERRSSTAWASLWHFVVIAGYAYVLARLVTWAFAKLAGLNSTIDGGKKQRDNNSRLNGLGWMLPALVFGDIAVNLLDLIVLWSSPPSSLIQYLLIGASKLLCIPALLAKWGGLLGVIGLIALALIAKPPRPLQAEHPDADRVESQ